jgi:VanZ family protein
MKSKNLHVGSAPTGWRRRLWSWGPALLIAAGIFGASSLPAAQLPEVGFPGIDKLEHGLVYALLGAALARGWRLSRARTTGTFTTRTRLAPAWLAAALATLAYGLSDELHQLLVPGRMFDLADLVADGVGGALGAAAYLWLRRRHAHAGIGDALPALQETDRS